MFTATTSSRSVVSCVISWIAVTSVLLCCAPRLARCDCECGYVSVINGTSYLFTDLLESDFRHIRNISLDTDWSRQEYNVTAAVARGPFGESPRVSQVISNPLLNKTAISGPSLLGGDAGLQLVVPRGIPSDGLVPVGELD